MKAYGWWILVSIACVALLFSDSVRSSESAVPTGEGQPVGAESPVERGRFLVSIGGCGDCHSPKKLTAAGPVEDESRLLSGHPSGSVLPEIPKGVVGVEKWGALTSADFTAWVGPWGVSFASNLTSDKSSGIGLWTADQFIKAMRRGKHRGFGRPILPPMPWPNLARLSDQDLTAILDYLKTVPPVVNKVPDPISAAGPTSAR